MKRKLQKGEFGFYKEQRCKHMFLTILFFAAVLAVFLTGLITTKSRMNVLTVVAVVGCLPACKQMVNCIMVFRKRPCDIKRYEQVREACGPILTSYELYITSPQKAYPLDCVSVWKREVFALAHPEEMDIKKCQSFIKEILKNNDKEVTVKIYQKENQYLEHLKRLQDKAELKPSEEETFIMGVLQAISV